MKLLLFIVVQLICISSFGQVQKDNSTWHFSASAGGLYSYLTEYKDSRVLGYNFGIKVEKLLDQKTSISSGLEYLRKGGDTKEDFGDIDFLLAYKYSQIALPLKVNYRIRPWISLNAGLYVGYNIMQELFYVVNFRNMHSRSLSGTRSEGYNIIDEEFDKIELGYLGGLAFHLGDNWWLNLQYGMSFGDLYNEDSYQLLVPGYSESTQALEYLIPDPMVRSTLNDRLLNTRNYYFSIQIEKRIW